eukprot:6181647-Pleurochrysis_carterae.AAC.5
MQIAAGKGFRFHKCSHESRRGLLSRFPCYCSSLKSIAGNENQLRFSHREMYSTQCDISFNIIASACTSQSSVGLNEVARSSAFCTARRLSADAHTDANACVSARRAPADTLEWAATAALIERIAARDPAARSAGVTKSSMAASAGLTPSGATASARPEARAASASISGEWRNRRSACRLPTIPVRRPAPPQPVLTAICVWTNRAVAPEANTLLCGEKRGAEQRARTAKRTSVL